MLHESHGIEATSIVLTVAIELALPRYSLYLRVVNKGGIGCSESATTAAEIIDCPREVACVA